MNKLIKLIYVNILNLFDINKIIIARNDGVKSNLEKKAIISGLIVVFYGYLIYRLFLIIRINNPYIIINIGYFISTLVCFFSNINSIEPVLFKSDDNEMLLSLPVSRYQIIFSKLFTIYIKNILYTVVILGAILLSYSSYEVKIDDLFSLIFIVNIFIIPFIPIIVATIIAYVNDYFKLKSNNSLIYRFIKLGLLLIILIIVIYLFKDIINYRDLNSLFSFIDRKIKIILPTIILFQSSLIDSNMFIFLLSIIIPVLLIYVYMIFITNHYLKMCSLLKGIKKKKEFEYKKVLNLHKILGVMKKELLYILHNKNYFNSSVKGMIIFSILVFILANIYDSKYFSNIVNYEIYLNTYLPMFLAMFVTMCNASICSFSLEKDNLQMLVSMPIKMSKIIIGKWLASVVIGLVFVLINGTIVSYYLKLDKVMIIYSYLIPFVALLFVTFTSLILDFRFIEKNEKDDNFIIKNRIVGFVPMLMAIFIGIGPMFLPLYFEYKYLLGSYVLGMILLMIGELICFLIRYKKLRMNLFK